MNKETLRKTVLSAMFLALGMVLPLFTAQIKEIGDTLLPMHLPVLLCGLICGPFYGLSVGLILPFLRSAVFGMPPLYPNAVWMALELGTYGGGIGLLYCRSGSKKIGRLYFCLVASMLAGRAVWGVSKALLLGFGGKPFTVQAFLAGGFLDAIPGIILQLILIPLIMEILTRTEMKKLKEKTKVTLK